MMGLFEKAEVIILKESSDAKAYLEKLEGLKKTICQNDELEQKLEREIAITKAGIIGEDQILFELKNSGMNLVVLHDIYLEDPNGNGAQIDFLVITPQMNVIIECKNLFGNIEINNKGEFIRTMEYGRKYHKEGIYSPITQNERHMRVLKEARKAQKGMIGSALYEFQFDKYHKSLIVLANPKTVVNDRYAPAAVKKQVIRADQLINVLCSLKSDVKSTKKEMLAVGERFLAMNIEDRKDYFAKYRELEQEYKEKLNAGMKSDLEKKATTEVKSNEPVKSLRTDKTEGKMTAELNKQSEGSKDNKAPMICPKCGRELVLRTAKKGEREGNQFWGCSGFPQCRYVKNL